MKKLTILALAIITAFASSSYATTESDLQACTSQYLGDQAKIDKCMENKGYVKVGGKWVKLKSRVAAT